MKLPVRDVQEFLAERGIDAWVLYDFHGQNPTALKALGLEGHMLTRRWFYSIPAKGKGEPTALVHEIEKGSWPKLPGQLRAYAGHHRLADELKSLIGSYKKIAMEYCPMGTIPYLSRVDAGTVERIRAMGIEVVSSADLVQWFVSRWDADQLESHKRASAALDAAREIAYKMVA